MTKQSFFSLYILKYIKNAILSSSMLLVILFAHAQKIEKQRTDEELHSLEKKYLRTTISKIIKTNGDVFLQRDMSPYIYNGIEKYKQYNFKDENEVQEHHNPELEIKILSSPHPSVATLEKYFKGAAKEFNVPVQLLKAYAQIQSNWTQNPESMYGSWGVMGLIESNSVKQISTAAQMIGSSVDDIEMDAQQNIRAGAALLSKYQTGTHDLNDLSKWFDAVKKLTGLSVDNLAYSLTKRIYNVASNGRKRISLWGEIINIQPTTIKNTPSISENTMMSTRVKTEKSSIITDAANSAVAVKFTDDTVDYPLAKNYLIQCRFGNRPDPDSINYYFIHYIAYGTYEGVINMWADCSTSTPETSATYLIRNEDGEVAQLVRESKRAWSQGTNIHNHYGIGVEHEVLVSDLTMWDNESLLKSSANLASNVCDRYGIPKIRVTTDQVANYARGIYGHSDVRSTACPNLTLERWANLMAHIQNPTLSSRSRSKRPVLYSITNPGTGNEVTVKWDKYPSSDTGLIGFRLYYANKNDLNTWYLAADEKTITSEMSSITLSPLNFINKENASKAYHFILTAISENDNSSIYESLPSDIYSRSINTNGKKVLLVDAYDERDGSFHDLVNPFLPKYFKALENANKDFQINSAHHKYIAMGNIDLTQYDLIVWHGGDASTTVPVLRPENVTLLKNYLEKGGHLFISGSEIGWTHGRSSTNLYGQSNRQLDFYNNYLKASFVDDGAAAYTPAEGVPGSIFAGHTIEFGITYPEDYPDAISPINGGESLLYYDTANYANKTAAVGYKGVFGSGTKEGGVIYLAFPLETAEDTAMNSALNSVVSYFSLSALALPITGLDFNVILSGSNASLKWSTLTEINTKHYEIERSSDGVTYSKINMVSAKGYSTTKTDYSYNDILDKSGIYYYRIKAVDLDGTYSYSDVRTVQYATGGSIKIYPNPARSIINISGISNGSNIRISDLNSRIIISRENIETSQLQINISGLISGMYLLQVEKNGKRIRSEKILINH